MECAVHTEYTRVLTLSFAPRRLDWHTPSIWLILTSLPCLSFSLTEIQQLLQYIPVSCQGTKINLYLVSTALNDGAGNRCTTARQPFLPYALSTLLHANTAICSLANLLFFLARPPRGSNSGSYLFLWQYLVMLGYNISFAIFLQYSVRVRGRMLVQC